MIRKRRKKKRVWKSQANLLLIIKDLFTEHTVKNNVRSLKWFRQDKSIYEIDIVVYEKDKITPMLLLEFDGKQHFESVRRFGGKKGFEQQKRRDAMKNLLLESNRQEYKHFIRFDYTETLTTEYVKGKLEENGLRLEN